VPLDDDGGVETAPGSRGVPAKPAAKKSSTGFDDMDKEIPF